MQAFFKKKNANAAKPSNNVVSNAVSNVANISNSADGSVIAAISAAVAAVMGEGVKFRLSKVSRADSRPRRSAWAAAGRNEQIYNRF